MQTFIVTGATSGLGLAIIKQLAKNPDHHVVLAVRDTSAANRLVSELEFNLGFRNLEVRQLDLCSIDSIVHFIEHWHGPVAGLVNNAGIQITGPTRYIGSTDIEETFFVNYLGALALTLGLLPHFAGSRVLFIGSGTHNPHNITANLFGFRGAQFSSVMGSARGISEINSLKQLGMDRYATAKLLLKVITQELAEIVAPSQAQFFCLDPGLMPGTGLARSASRVERFLWCHLLPLVAPLLPDTSTVSRSALAAHWLMTETHINQPNGTIFDFTRRPSQRVWDHVYTLKKEGRVLAESIDLLNEVVSLNLYERVWGYQLN